MADSKLSLEQALADNPADPTPEDIRETLGLTEVEYVGFDGRQHIGQMVVAVKIMAEVEAFFRRAAELGFPIAKVVPAADSRYARDDEKLMADNASSGFNYRLIAGSHAVSTHGRGLAFDINPRQNPYIRYEKGKKIVQPRGAVWDKAKPGTLFADHPLVLLMEGFGWEWGGSWTRASGRIDYQHFEKQS